MERAIKRASIGSRGCRDDSLSRDACSFGFEFQGPCSAFTSWRARERDPKTFSLAAHNQELVLRHMTFALQQLFQISFERGLCEVIDFFAPPREDFLLGGKPAYMSEG